MTAEEADQLVQERAGERFSEFVIGTNLLSEEYNFPVANDRDFFGRYRAIKTFFRKFNFTEDEIDDIFESAIA